MVNEALIITNKLYEEGKSVNGGWSDAQLKCLGIENKLKGWRRASIGRPVTQAQIDTFLSMKDQHLGQNTISRLSGAKERFIKEIYDLSKLLNQADFVKSVDSLYDIFKKN